MSEYVCLLERGGREQEEGREREGEREREREGVETDPTYRRVFVYRPPCLTVMRCKLLHSVFKHLAPHANMLLSH